MCEMDIENRIQTEITIEQLKDLLEVEHYIRELKENNALSDKKYNEMSVIMGELGENILKHSGRGKITIVYDDSDQPFIEAISENIRLLPEHAKKDGISTKGSLGIGLGIVHRLSDGVYYEQDGDILRIRSIKYCSNSPTRSEVVVLSYPFMSEEKSNGDAYLIFKNKSDLLCVIDALGHGKDAYRSAVAVQDFIRKNYKNALNGLIHEIHHFIRDSHELRGVMISFIRIDYEMEKLFYCGLGDVMVKIFLPYSAETWYPIPKDGIVGDHYSYLKIQEFEVQRGMIIAMFTDGVSAKLSIAQSQRLEKPVSLVNDLMKRYGKPHDDRTLLLAKIL
jgi:anti-sigma regulatory factor (Ser/Thr protein kinase)